MEVFGWINLDLHSVTYCLPSDYTHHKQNTFEVKLIWLHSIISFCAVCLILKGNQLGENKQHNLSITEDNLQLNYRRFPNIKTILHLSIAKYLLYGGYLLNWTQRLIDVISDQLPMCHHTITVLAITNLQ